MTGWRLGYGVWPSALINQAETLAINIHSCVNAAAQYAGIAALTGPQDAVGEMVAAFHARRRVVVEALNRLPGVTCALPGGAFYAFPNVTGSGWGDKALADALLEEAGVALLAGSGFGRYGEGFLFVNYAASTENILEAVSRMADFLGRHPAPGP